MMRLHYIQHVPFENPGSILTWAKENGHVITFSLMFQEASFPKISEFDWLLIMGGPMNIYEEAIYPWLIKEKEFIKEAIDSGKVLIGLCLGGQLIADVIGGKVTKNPYPEIGWFPVKLSEKIRQSPLFSFFPEEPVVFSWHGDTFSILPEEAEIIASNEACKNQAFVYKNRVFGFQYHLENTPEIISALVENCREEMIPGPFVQTPEEVLSKADYIKQDNKWMNQFLTQLEILSGEGDI